MNCNKTSKIELYERNSTSDFGTGFPYLPLEFQAILTPVHDDYTVTLQLVC